MVITPNDSHALASFSSLAATSSLASLTASPSHRTNNPSSISAHPSSRFATLSGSKSYRGIVSFRLGTARSFAPGTEDVDGFWLGDRESDRGGGSTSGTVRVDEWVGMVIGRL